MELLEVIEIKNKNKIIQIINRINSSKKNKMLIKKEKSA
jgi:hypothetical protein